MRGARAARHVVVPGPRLPAPAAGWAPRFDLRAGFHAATGREK